MNKAVHHHKQSQISHVLLQQSLSNSFCQELLLSKMIHSFMDVDVKAPCVPSKLP